MDEYTHTSIDFPVVGEVPTVIFPLTRASRYRFVVLSTAVDSYPESLELDDASDAILQVMVAELPYEALKVAITYQPIACMTC